MNSKLTINKVILFFALGSFVLNFVLLAYIFLNNNQIKPVTLGARNQILGKWEKVVLPEEQPYEIEVTPIIFMSSYNSAETATPLPIIKQTVVPQNCRTTYPKELEFFSDGTYTASRTSLLQPLKGGEYQITDDGRLKTKFFDNSLVTIDLSFENDKMTIILPDCKIDFQKVNN